MDSQEKKQPESFPAAAEEKYHCETDLRTAYYLWAADKSSHKMKIYGDDENKSDSGNETPVCNKTRSTSTTAGRPKRKRILPKEQSQVSLVEDEVVKKKKMKRSTSPLWYCSSSTPSINRSLVTFDVASSSNSSTILAKSHDRPELTYFHELISKRPTRKRSPADLISDKNRAELISDKDWNRRDDEYQSQRRRKGKQKVDEEVKYECKICDVTFETGQALGGHMSSHNNKKKNGDGRVIYNSVFESLFETRIPVRLGKKYQIELPECKGDALLNDEVERKMARQKMGSRCVILPMPVSEVGKGKSKEQCSCKDKGSVICVKQHVGEARDKMKERLGKHSFEEMGMSDMGEVVAGTWTVKDELAFKQVVLTTKKEDVWKALWEEFNDRTKKEIQSYYYNVYILSRIAEQSRRIAEQTGLSISPPVVDSKKTKSSVLAVDIDSDDGELREHRSRERKISKKKTKLPDVVDEGGGNTTTIELLDLNLNEPPPVDNL